MKTRTPVNPTPASTARLRRVAIVGRPNVGKSTLINRLVGHREAIVHDEPGVTRDRSYHTVTWSGQTFTVVDTGGLTPDAGRPDLLPETGDFSAYINAQVEAALEESDLVVFVVDAHAGITALDDAVAHRLRTLKKPILLAVNKVDQPEQRPLMAEFYALGLGEPRGLSAMHGSGGVGDLLDAIIAGLPPEPPPEEVDAADETTVRLALVGRPNVGKSSILNTLCGGNRTIVSNIPGTTRDAIDVQLEHEGESYILVDTAGIRKKGKVDFGVEMFSVDRSLRAIRKADVAVVVLAAPEGVTDQDKRIIGQVLEAGRGLVLAVNQWDLIPNKTAKSAEAFKKEILKELPHASFAPIVLTSALKGQRLTQLLSEARRVSENHRRRVSTSLVNQVLQEATTQSPPPAIKNRRLKLLYGTQVASGPPTFVLFVNDANLLKDSYKRYLEKQLRLRFEFAGTPIILMARNRETVTKSK